MGFENKFQIESLNEVTWTTRDESRTDDDYENEATEQLTFEQHFQFFSQIVFNCLSRIL